MRRFLLGLAIDLLVDFLPDWFRKTIAAVLVSLGFLCLSLSGFFLTSQDETGFAGLAAFILAIPGVYLLIEGIPLFFRK
ncbi:MAG: hypothetical protein CMB42_05050 [Euryarchaeota archaeon]|nr:hypothetical protein [Euryarchaeota archaeon]|tara:strand:- start:1958 stop:2194 length:237 start_codon:yes stop_codon:yes gene_type:complete